MEYVEYFLVICTGKITKNNILPILQNLPILYFQNYQKQYYTNSIDFADSIIQLGKTQL